MLKLIYFVPQSHLEETKTALFKAGAGTMGEYEHCAWQVKGLGQFKPKSNAQPFLGKVDQLTHVEEWRVEIIVPDHLAKQVLTVLQASHPYEEPAFEFIQLLEIN